ncbi:MAG: hypothetical protein LBN95_00590 [Prevotellaceae bacterium]|jgi:hypothetical protein|nr:hypothetical protein [Prevotellaceae bacterium]
MKKLALLFICAVVIALTGCKPVEPIRTTHEETSYFNYFKFIGIGDAFTMYPNLKTFDFEFFKVSNPNPRIFSEKKIRNENENEVKFNLQSLKYIVDNSEEYRVLITCEEDLSFSYVATLNFNYYIHIPNGLFLDTNEWQGYDYEPIVSFRCFCSIYFN